MKSINLTISLMFSILVLLSGFLCFTLEKDWFKNISSKAKVPSYALLSVSIAFAFIHSTLDLI
jgi:hypothetical protein